MKRCLCLCLLAATAIACQSTSRQDNIVLKTIRVEFIFPLNHTYIVSTDPSERSPTRLPMRMGDHPEWSPDGKWVVFHSPVYSSLVTHRKNAAIYIVSARGGPWRQVTANEGFLDPTWAPDGTRVAVWHKGGIYLVDVQCAMAAKPCVAEPTLLTKGYSPDWSPAGDQIVYLSPDRHLAVIDIDGNSDPTILISDFSAGEPKWSPSGDKIAFDASPTNGSDIFVINPDGTGLTNLTNDEGSSATHDWSPDGTKVAFVSNRGGLGKTIWGDLRSNALFVMNADGTDVVRLTDRDNELVLWFAWIGP